MRMHYQTGRIRRHVWPAVYPLNSWASTSNKRGVLHHFQCLYLQSFMQTHPQPLSSPLTSLNEIQLRFDRRKPRSLKPCLADGKEPLDHKLHALVDLPLMTDGTKALEDAAHGKEDEAARAAGTKPERRAAQTDKARPDCRARATRR